MHDCRESLPKAKRLTQKRELVIELAAVCVGLLNAAAGDTLIELCQLQIGDDAVLGEAGTQAVPIVEEILATLQTFMTRRLKVAARAAVRRRRLIASQTGGGPSIGQLS